MTTVKPSSARPSRHVNDSPRTDFRTKAVGRTLDDMADDFSIRARKARLAQGLPEVLSDRAALSKLSSLVATGAVAVPPPTDG